MKLLSLNVWGATQGQVLLDYVKAESKTVDIFCFQEVFSALPGAPQISSGAKMFLFEELAELLPDFTSFFSARSLGADFNGLVDYPVSQGLGLFVKKHLQIVTCNDRVLQTNDIATMEDPGEGWTKAQVVTLSSGAKKFSVINFHGMAQPGTKLDTPQRLNQSKRLLLILESLKGAKILCGDFNLMPEAASISMLEGGMDNLIKTYNIKNTRNEVSWGMHSNKQHYADFTFTSPEIKVKSFEVPYNEVSDHLPMLLDFSL
jgi:endonuclease/exonuclease/phosphatase family metal-dependent hydrolase